MNKLTNRMFLGAALGVAMTLGLQAKYPEIGQPAPDFTLTDVNGKNHKLSDYRGKLVVLEWVNPECPVVLNHYNSGNLPALQKRYIGQGVVWLAINSGHAGAQGDFAPARIKEWLQDKGAAHTAYFRDQDGRIGRLYGATNTPGMYVVAKDGLLAYAGAIDSIPGGDPADIAKATNYVGAALTNLMAGKAVATSMTRQYGCNVKYGR
ncbi:MAG: alkyl hydroperoxide reductase [Verrucomicrobia bacterium RIFCSPLOWO2_12_FULL_64_8]|nr:MAG: alkyl hydroperoxide reductase [Verrucomicrobia bacterium RIFCSPLOWO2_12_FULL_64_8]